MRGPIYRDADLIQVDAEKFKRDADVVAEAKGFQHVNDVVAVGHILFA